MGWKNLKELYKIVHTVQVTDKGICIGSSYIHDIIVIDAEGRISKRYERSGGNNDLQRYMREMEEDPERLRRLVLSPDDFTASIAVYTYSDGDIIEKRCEALGWPNVTHDGALMYENTFSADKEKVVEWAKESADIGIKWARESAADAEEQLAKCRKRLAEAETNRAKLEAAYPPNIGPECRAAMEKA